MRSRRSPLLSSLAAAVVLAACGDGATGPGDRGSLTISVSGAAAASPAVRVMGDGFDSTISATTTFARLAPGTYTISAPNVAGATPLYSAALTQTVTVAHGQSSHAGVRYSALPIAGAHVPALDAFDSTMIAFMTARNIRAGAVAVSYNGVVRYARAFGWKDAAQTEPLGADAMFRLASVTKPITAAAIRKQIIAGKFSLSTPVFNYLGLTPAGTVVDPRIYDITVNHLLEHEGGWNRDVAGDFMFATRAIAGELGIATAPTKTQVAQWAMTQPLQFAPGSARNYSNFGYSLLGLMVEKATGMTFLEYVKANVFGAESGNVVGARSLLVDRDAREPFYSDPNTGCSVFQISTCVVVPYPDGGMHMEGYDACAGLVASASAVATFLSNYWMSGDARSSNGLSYYFLGSMPGTYTLARQRSDGVNIVVLFNQRTDASGLGYDKILDDMDLAATRSSWWQEVGAVLAR